MHNSFFGLVTELKFFFLRHSVSFQGQKVVFILDLKNEIFSNLTQFIFLF